jgi:predicted permease
MAQFLLFVAVVLGVAAIVRRAAMAETLADSLNWWVLNVALPAMALELLPGLHADRSLWFLVVAWTLFVLTALLCRWLGARLGWTRQRIGAVTLLAALSNTAFVGLPMLDALRGPAAVSLGLLADQLGCFIALAVGGSIVTAIYSGDRTSAREIARRVLLYPAFVASLVGLAVGALGGWPEAIPPMLHRLSQTLTPLALFSVGLRFRLHARADERPAIAMALAWKLGAMPLVVLLAGRALDVQGLTLTVGVLQAAMPSMFAAAILIRQHGLESEMADTTLSVGMLLSFATASAWSLLLP